MFGTYFLQEQITNQGTKGLKNFLPSSSVLRNKMGQKYHVMPGIEGIFFFNEAT